MKKSLSILFVLIATLSLAGCAKKKEPTPAEALEPFLKSYISEELPNTMGKAGSDEEAEVALYDQLQKMYEGITYTVVNEENDGDHAVLDVTFNTYDFTASYTGMYDRVIEAVLDAEDYDSFDVNTAIYQYWKEELEKAEEAGPQVTFDYSFSLDKEENVWKVDEDSINKTLLNDKLLAELISYLTGQ